MQGNILARNIDHLDAVTFNYKNFPLKLKKEPDKQKITEILDVNLDDTELYTRLYQRSP